MIHCPVPQGQALGLHLVFTALILIAGANARADDVIRARARPEIPWVTAVLAPSTALSAEDTKRVAASSLALSDVGVRIRIEKLDGFDVVVVEGPPEQHDTITKAARAAVPAGGVLFVDGRTALVDKGALPPRSAASTKLARAPTQLVMPLAPAPSLLDVEGEALALFIEKTLDGEQNLVDARIDARASATHLVVEALNTSLVEGNCPRGGHCEDPAVTRNRVREKLNAALASPLPTRAVEDLRTKARAVVARRRAKAGGWARDMALMWLAYGTIDVEEPIDLGSALRARVFPSVLVR